MHSFFELLILAARRSEPGKKAWQEIFVFVLMAVIWLVGGISKMKANKAAQDRNKQKKQPPPNRPKPAVRPLQAQALHKQQQQRKTLFRHPEFEKIAQAEKYIQQLNQEQPTAEQGDQKMPFVKTEPEIENEQAYDLLQGLHDKNQLRNAILYHEILGKPKALQDME